MIRIAAADARFAETSPDAQALKTVDAQVAVADAAPLAYRTDGTTAYFAMGELRPGVPIEIPVQLDGTDLVFFPERSAAQRRILTAIGQQF